MKSQYYLLYTSNYKLAKNEIIIRGGKILWKITKRVFIAAIPVTFSAEELKFSSIHKPEDLDQESERVAETFKDWNNIKSMA